MSNRIRLSLVAAASLVALVLVALFVTQASPTAASADGAVKIGVIDTGKIVESSATGRNARVTLEQFQQQAEAEGMRQQAEIKDLQAKIQNGQSLPENQLTQLKKQLEDKMTAFRRWQDDTSREGKKKQDAILADFERKVMPLVNQIGKEMGYTAIFRKFESGLIYVDEATDITAMVIQRLDTGATTRLTDTSANRTVGAGTASPSGRPDIFMVTPSGNVGIGTASTDPTGNGGRNLGIFHSTARAELDLQSGATGTTAIVGQISFYGSTTNQLATIQTSAAGAADSGTLRFFTMNAGSVTEKMRMTSTGNVGIGTTAPDQKFSVNGDASKVGGGSWQSFSDERLKNIKGGFNSGLKAVMRLQPIRYEYKRDNVLGLKSEGDHVGFGAQALQKIIPEAVSQNPDGYLMVNNDPILWTMLNAIKEQQKEIAELKTEARKLQATSRRHRK